MRQCCGLFMVDDSNRDGGLAMPTQATNQETPIVNSNQQQVRELAVKQIERKRRFRMRAFSAAAATVVLVIMWAISEYNNAGGWPTNGFSQSSSIPHVWNIWIIYPLIGIALILALDAWNTYRQQPISESEIRREMDRLTGAH
jgi:protein-S-isoprenylcysteine O-methyltransferase Ste14